MLSRISLLLGAAAIALGAGIGFVGPFGHDVHNSPPAQYDPSYANSERVDVVHRRNHDHGYDAKSPDRTPNNTEAH